MSHPPGLEFIHARLQGLNGQGGLHLSWRWRLCEGEGDVTQQGE